VAVGFYALHLIKSFKGVSVNRYCCIKSVDLSKHNFSLSWQSYLAPENLRAKEMEDATSTASAAAPAMQQQQQPTKTTRGIVWDEETIREHDKERGTRQRIDEPPTPYRYQSGGSVCSDSGESGDGEHSEGERSMTSTTPPSRSSVVGGSSGDNRATIDWSTLHAKLHYERQLQLEAAGTGRSEGEEMLEGKAATASFVPSLSRHAERTVFCLDNRLDEAETAEPDPLLYKQFKDKRNAHYNEYKVIQALRKSRTLSEDDEDEDEDDVKNHSLAEAQVEAGEEDLFDGH
jgi:hypothetical protein